MEVLEVKLGMLVSSSCTDRGVKIVNTVTIRSHSGVRILSLITTEATEVISNNQILKGSEGRDVNELKSHLSNGGVSKSCLELPIRNRSHPPIIKHHGENNKI